MKIIKTTILIEHKPIKRKEIAIVVVLFMYIQQVRKKVGGVDYMKIATKIRILLLLYLNLNRSVYLH